MAKTGPLSDLEKFWIEEKRDETNVEDMAKKLDRSKSSISSYIKKLDKKSTDDAESSFKVGEKIPTNNNPVVMTEGQSQLGDLIYQQGQTISERLASCITSSKKK